MSFTERITAWMSHPAWPSALSALLGAIGIWLLLPRGTKGGRRIGGLLAAAAVAVLGTKFPTVGSWGHEVVFAALAIVTVVSAVGAVTFRSPVYCAIWFALTLMGTSGLFLFQGAQFLGVATIVVYAGAILVTFLFVLMLAQPRGLDTYDRISWEPLLGSCTGAALVGLLTYALRTALATPDPGFAAVSPTTNEVLATAHVATLGAQLFSRHLVAVEAAGALLLVAVVGAVAITMQRGAGQRRERGPHYE